MHVAIVTTSYPDSMPGSEAAGSFVADFASQLAKAGDVTVIAAASGTSRVREGNLEVWRFAVPRLPLSLLRPWLPTDWAAILRTIMNGRTALQAAVRERKPDYIFALWALPSGYWAATIGQRQTIPFGIWALGSDIWSLGKIPLLRGILRRVLRAADNCFADGLELADDVARLSGRSCAFLASTRSLPAVPAGSKSGKPPYKLAFLGRWHRNKGIDLLLEALGQLGEGDWNRISAVRIFGGGPMHGEVHRAVSDLKKQGRPVEAGGFLDKEQAARLIAWADYLLLPSRIESIPVVFSDAVQLRTPIVSTPVGDLPDLHEKYGFGLLAPAIDVPGYVHALRTALSADARSFDGGLASAATDFDPGEIVRRFRLEIGGSRSA